MKNATARIRARLTDAKSIQAGSMFGVLLIYKLYSLFPKYFDMRQSRVTWLSQGREKGELSSENAWEI